MKKCYLIVAVVMCATVAGFAQNAEQAVLDTQKEFFDAVKKGIENQKKSNLGKIRPEWQQFLLEYSKTQTFLNLKNDTLSLGLFKPVFSRMIKPKNNVVANEVYVSNVGISKIDDVRNKKGDIKNYIYTTENEVGIVAVKDDTLYSNARYSVRIDWNVKWTVKKGDTAYIASIADIKTSEMPYLTHERQQMGQTAEKLIEQWYAGLSNGTFEEYNPVSFTVMPGDVSVEMPDGLEVVVSNVPDICVYVDPEQFMTEDRSLYPEPIEAYYILKPTFKVVINNDLSSGTVVSVDYGKTLHKPETAAERLEKYTKLENFINGYVNDLKAYAANPDKSLRNSLGDMFVDKTSSVVEVSNIASGEEKVYTRTAEQYLERLKTASITVELGTPVIGEGLVSVIYPAVQQFESTAYSDCTEKEIHLLYDAEANGYLIDKISVVKGSTRKLSE